MTKIIIVSLGLFGLFGGTLRGQDQHKIDSLRRVLQTSKQDTHRVVTLIRLTQQLPPDSAKILAKEALDLATLLKYQKGQGFALHTLGHLYYNNYQYEEAIFYLKKAGAVFQKIKNVAQLPKTLSLLGDAYLYDEQYVLSIENYNKTLQLCAVTKDDLEIGFALQGIGNVYRMQKKYEAALDYYKKSLSVHQKLKKIRNVAQDINWIGVVYFQQKKFQDALRYFQQAKELYSQIDYQPGIGHSLQNIGNVYNSIDLKSRKGIECYKEAQVVFKALGDIATLTLLANNIAGAYAQLRMPKEALAYSKQATVFAQETGANYQLYLAYDTRKEIDSLLCDFRSAYLHSKLAERYSDSLYNEETTLQISKVETRYEIENRIATETRAENSAAAAATAARQARDNRQYLGITVGLIVLFSAAFIFRRRTQKNRGEVQNASPVRYAGLDKIFAFVALLLTFEFILLISEPVVDSISGKAPIFSLFFNVLFALLFTPVYRLVARKVSA